MIPKTLHIWTPVKDWNTDLVDTLVQSILKQCPGWNIVTHAGKPKKMGPSLERAYNRGGIKTRRDLAKLHILLEYGGFCIDAHCRIEDSLDTLSESTVCLAAIDEWDSPTSKSLSGHLLAAPRNSPVIRGWISLLEQNAFTSHENGWPLQVINQSRLRLKFEILPSRRTGARTSSHPGGNLVSHNGGAVWREAYLRSGVRYPLQTVQYFSYDTDCGIGEAGSVYQNLLREAGFQVTNSTWTGQSSYEALTCDGDTLYVHHWHPQPGDSVSPDIRRKFSDSIHVAFWAYEAIDYIPKEFKEVVDLFRQIWVPSTFCKGIFDEIHPDVRVVPHVVEEEPVKGLGSDDIFTVAFWFDAWSRFNRKNPEAIVRVFRRAFPVDQDVRLIMKCHHLSPDQDAYLRFLTKDDDRIELITHFLVDDAFEQVWNDTDCLLSLQRSEGFGLNIAKSIAKGIPVITTGFGGHLDFSEGVAELVPFRVEPVATFADGFYDKGCWAEPDENESIALLRKVRQGFDREKLSRGVRRMNTHYNRSSIMEAISTNLEDLVLNNGKRHRINSFGCTSKSMSSFTGSTRI